ncbi:MAG TPA: peptidyl-prolyl cis-trans isomerase [Terriglobales bacterium]|nr:peptidyl-prolyl cis-trans isomerase [Terriglobales bacterium]
MAAQTPPAKTQTPPAGSKATKPATQSAPAQTPAKTAASTQTPAKPAPAAGAGEPGPEAVIVTINGVCPAATPAENCKRTITRAEFERVVSAVNPELPTDSRRQLAALYVQLITMANEAEKAGLDKDPAFAERLRLERLRVLAQATEKKLQETSKPSEQDVENFYAENSSRFEEFSLRRIVVPKTIGGEAKIAEMKALADKVRARATAGEDADKLEAEVYATAKMPGAPPSTNLGWKRRGAMDPRHEPQIVALKAGQLSEVIEDAQSYYVYKVDAKRIIPLATVKDDIERGLAGQATENKIRALLGSIRVDMNEGYFGPPPAPPAAQQPPSAPPKQ